MQDQQQLKGLELLQQQTLDACTHCGLCLPTCPTYRELGLETDSPRGRIYLIQAVLDGETPVNEDFAKYIYRCLDWRACETACPSGIHYGEIIEAARAIYEMNVERPKEVEFWRNLVFNQLLPYKDRLDILFGLMWFYQQSGLQTLTRKLGLLKLMGKMGEMEGMLPKLPNPTRKAEIRNFMPAEGKAKYRLGFIPGCVMNQIFVDTNLSTIRVLNKNGCDVMVPSQQNCCGALHVHNGAYDTALKLAKQNLDAFDDEVLDAIVINAAGCGATLKEYEVLMKNESEAYQQKAEQFCRKVKDISEFLAEIDFQSPTNPIKRKVTYDAPCHLVHGQQVQSQPLKLLQSIPGLDLIPLRESDWCCGSAGIYNILQPEIADKFLQQKIECLTETKAEIVATGNPGCLLQIEAGIKANRLSMQVMHPIDLLDCAYRGIDPLA